MLTRLDNKQLSEWYLLISQQIEAGVTLSQAVMLAGYLDDRTRDQIVTHLEAGMDAAEVFQNFAPWIPATDQKLISAAQASGRLPEVLSAISVRRMNIHENVKKAVNSCYYPIFIVHLAAFVTPIFNLFEINFHSGSFTLHPERYLPIVINALLIAWGIIITAAVLLRQNNPRVLSVFPIIRQYSVLQSISDFAALMSAFLKAGATAETAWLEAGGASSDPNLRQYSEEISLKAKQGYPPGGELNPKESPLPPEFISLYVSGEQTGQLDKNLDLLAKLFQEKANLKLKQASEFYPMIIFLGVAVYVGFGLVRFYNQYLDLLLSIIKPG